MWSSRRSRWISVSLFLALFFTYCSSRLQQQPYSCNPNSSKANPVICVDNAGNPNPPKQGAWDEDHGHHPVVVIWRANSAGAKLNVKFTDNTCSDGDPICHQGQCIAMLKKQSWRGEPGERVVCKYESEITTVTGETHDPFGELIVNPCCW